MRFALRLGLAGSVVLCGLDVACSLTSGLDGVSKGASLADGGDAGSTPPTPPQTSDGSAPADSGEPRAPKGDFVWELHGNTNFAAVGNPVHVSFIENDTAFAATMLGTTSFEDRVFTGPGTGFFSFDDAKKGLLQGMLPHAALGAMALDSAGDLYVGGSFASKYLVFQRANDILELDNTYPGRNAAFVVKIDHTTGKVLWGWSNSPTPYTNGDLHDSYTSAIATQGTDVAVSVVFDGRLELHPVPSATITIVAKSEDSLVLRFDPATGSLQGQVWIGGAGAQEVKSLAMTEDLGLLVGGTLTAGNVEIGGQATSVTSTSSYFEPFVFRIGSAMGAPLVMAKLLGTSLGNASETRAVALAPDGDVLACGAFDSHLSDAGVPSKGGHDAFVTRLASDGTVKWLRPYGGTVEDACNGVAADPSGQVVFALDWGSSSVEIDDHALTDPAVGHAHAGVVKLDADGHFLWASEVLADQAHIHQVRVLPQGDVLSAGEFIGTANLGAGDVVSAATGTKTTAFLARRTY